MAKRDEILNQREQAYKEATISLRNQTEQLLRKQQAVSNNYNLV